MSSVTFAHIGYITSIEPGDTHHVSWNNAAAQRVWAFSVDARLSLKTPPAIGAPARVEITRVEYREVNNGSGNLEKEIHWYAPRRGPSSRPSVTLQSVVLCDNLIGGVCGPKGSAAAMLAPATSRIGAASTLGRAYMVPFAESARPSGV